MKLTKSIKYLKIRLKLGQVLTFTASMTSHTGKRGALVQMYFRNDLRVLLSEQVRKIEQIRYFHSADIMLFSNLFAPRG